MSDPEDLPSPNMITIFVVICGIAVWSLRENEVTWTLIPAALGFQIPLKRSLRTTITNKRDRWLGVRPWQQA